MLAGFTSRWTMPCLWAAANPKAAWWLILSNFVDIEQAFQNLRR